MVSAELCVKCSPVQLLQSSLQSVNSWAANTAERYQLCRYLSFSWKLLAVCWSIQTI